MILHEVNLNQGRIGVEMEMLIRLDLSRDADTHVTDPRFRAKMRQVFTDCGFTLGDDPTVIQHSLSTDIFYASFETANQELEGAAWSDLEPRLTALLSWLKRNDRVWVDRMSHAVTTIPQSGASWADTVLPRAKMPNNTTCGLHIHFHAEDWFGDFDHAIRFVQLWNRSRDFFKKLAHPARYKTGQGYVATGDEHADISKPMSVPTPDTVRRLKAEWEMTPTGYQVRKILKWMSLHRWTALNTTRVEFRKDIEFRLAHGTMNIGTITHWVSMFASLIEAAKETRMPSTFTRYMWSEERPLMVDYLKRSGKLAKADTSHAAPYDLPKRMGRPIRRLLYPQNAKFIPVKSEGAATH